LIYLKGIPMKLDRLTKKYPIMAAILVVLIMTILTESPVSLLRNAFAPLMGRFYGDYLADALVNTFGTVCLLLAAVVVGLGGKLGLKRPRPWAAALLGWPLLLLAIPDVDLSELVFDPILLVIFIFLFFGIGFIEELLFRGYVQGFILRNWDGTYWRLIGGVLLANLIFASAHLVNLALGRTTLLYALGQFTFAFFFGVFFSALYVRSGSLWPGIGLHMLYDFMVNLDAFSPDALPRSEIVRTNTPEGLLIGLLLTLPLLLVGLFYLRKSKLQLPPQKEIEA
jgi:membrane protease YdiL (CAAX protease family)